MAPPPTEESGPLAEFTLSQFGEWGLRWSFPVCGHFSASVLSDVEAQGGGDAGSLTPRRSATLAPLLLTGMDKRSRQVICPVGEPCQSFSSTWGWVVFAPGDAWNLPSEGTGVGGSGWSVQPKGPAQWCWPIFNSLHAACTYG